VARARALQMKRQDKPNGHLGLKETERWCRPEPEAGRFLEHAMERFGFSARAYQALRWRDDCRSGRVANPRHNGGAVQQALDRTLVGIGTTRSGRTLGTTPLFVPAIAPTRADRNRPRPHSSSVLIQAVPRAE
jgi:hypothetical protein